MKKSLSPHIKNGGRLCGLMFINYGINAVSFRLLAKGSYLGVALSDAALAWWGFTMVKKIGDAETRFEQAMYTLGGIGGSLLGLWLTEHL